MFRIFVTTWIYSGNPNSGEVNSVSIATHSIPFESRQEAERAMQSINESEEIPFRHKAIPLYK